MSITQRIHREKTQQTQPCPLQIRHKVTQVQL
jgi:hypothetical protein